MSPKSSKEPVPDPSTSAPSEPGPRFESLGLSQPILKALAKLGYEEPTPIQAETIPLLLSGKDMLGQAQTGTGKTAAFALPILQKIDVKSRATQALVLAPTRELAIQVAEAFQQYASQLKGFNVLPIYGGQDYRGQFKGLDRGAHVVVGTPGRVMDHLKRGSLKLDGLKTLVLDEADEMLRMGFIDDVQWIIEQTPKERQVVLFSATMPPAIRRVADRYLNDVQEVRIKSKTATAANIDQVYWLIRGINKLDALTRILEVEDFDGVLIFVRTRNATTELADRLEARGHSTAAINGDLSQSARERVISQFKRSKVDVLVATDVAARGIDVDRISHVINYDIPHDNEGYVHRIGRTGRAGRSGKAILFVAPREKRLLYNIERTTKQKITEMQLPGGKEVGEKRVRKFKEMVVEALEAESLSFFVGLAKEIAEEQERSVEEVAAALIRMQQRDRPLEVRDVRAPKDRNDTDSRLPENFAQIVYQLDVGSEHNVRVGDIVGAITHEADITNRSIGRIRIFSDHSTIELPTGMSKDTFDTLSRLQVRRRPLNLKEIGPAEGFGQRDDRGKGSFPSTRPSRPPRGPSNDKKKFKPRPSKGPVTRDKPFRAKPPRDKPARDEGPRTEPARDEGPRPQRAPAPTERDSGDSKSKGPKSPKPKKAGFVAKREKSESGSKPKSLGERLEAEALGLSSPRRKPKARKENPKGKPKRPKKKIPSSTVRAKKKAHRGK